MPGEQDEPDVEEDALPSVLDLSAMPEGVADPAPISGHRAKEAASKPRRPRETAPASGDRPSRRLKRVEPTPADSVADVSNAAEPPAAAEVEPSVDTALAESASETALAAPVAVAASPEPEIAPALTGTEHLVEAAETGAGNESPEPAQESVVADGPLPPRQESPLVEELGPIEKPVSDEDAAIPPPPPVDALPPAQLRPVVEALLFVSQKPLSLERLCRALPGLEANYAEGFLHGLAARYDAEGRGWALVREAGGWRLLTRAEHHAWVRQLDRRELPSRLSRGAIEVLSVIAYQQPVARSAIEDIRGVQCAHVIQQLLELRLVRVVGRDEGTLGRPWLYGTTDQFLTRFGLGSIDDLPRRHEFGG
jgi:segregation and condensation protein B